MKCLAWLAYFFIYTSFRTVGGSAELQESLPFCETHDTPERYVFVSTLDGQLTALDAENGGSVMWSVLPGDMPMLSSSIHRLELTNYGQLVRMIPSLNGGLYKFNGDNVEPIPLTAEHLIQSSFRYSDDLVISGGKESQTMGVSLKTGEVLYECSMRGCSEEETSANGDVLIIQRQGQIVRAVEPRSGVERWNFSVAQHQLKLLSECHVPGPVVPLLQLKVIVPEGLVCALDPKDSNNVLWQHKFSSPVVSAWEVQKGQLFDVDLFGRTTQVGTSTPSIYIGMHKKQLYIQESVQMLRKRQELTQYFGQKLLTQESKDVKKLPWRPVIANTHTTELQALDGSDNETALEESRTTALSVLYASPFVDGLGFYLFTEEELKKSEGLCNVTILEDEADHEEEEQSAETPVTIVIVSLWYWWKEVMIISITTALIFNYFTRRFTRLRDLTSCEVPLLDKPQNGSDSGVIVETLNVVRSEPLSTPYVSRYLTDFDHLCCMGKGGFGVVFQAKNRIDDCHYAIKRIVLPDAPESRERVMREVRALAKLDNQYIVRYFNAWVENPPPGWQTEKDRVWMQSLEDSMHSGLSSGATTEATSASVFKTKEPPSSMMSNASQRTFGLPSKCASDQSDSFIVFASDSQTNDVPDEHSILIESSASSIAKTKQRGKRPSEEDWAHNSTICRSPSKVYLYIQMQLCQRQSLKDWLINNHNREYDAVINIFEQIVRAVEYVHQNNLIHRDLKPSNIFFSLDQQIKVGDFGLVTNIEDDASDSTRLTNGFQLKNGRGHTAQVGTQLYMSPEQLSGKPYSYKVDIFSLGLILFELLVPFSTQMERMRVLQNIRRHKYPEDFAERYADEMNLLELMLSDCPDDRPTTFALRARPPLLRDVPSSPPFEFPSRKRERSGTSTSSVSSCDIGVDC